MDKKTKLREIREKSGLTQKQVAQAVGIAESAYQRYEYGRIPSAVTAVRIAKAIGTTVENIYG